MTVGYDISLATPDDIFPASCAAPRTQAAGSDGSLPVRLTEDWFRRVVSEKSVLVGRRNGKVASQISLNRSQPITGGLNVFFSPHV
jgi:hypothetical protein